MEKLKKELESFEVGPRLKSLSQFWDQNFANIDAILIRDGIDADGVLKIKTIALHAWIFRCELTNTLLSITRDKIILLASEDKIESLEAMRQKVEEGGFSLVLLVKKSDKYQDCVSEFIKKVKESAKPQPNKKIVLGCFLKEKQKGKIIDEFDRQVNESNEFEEQDIGVYIQDLFSVKREEDIPLVNKSAKVLTFFYQKLIGIIEDTIENEKEIAHSEISFQVEKMLSSLDSEYTAKYKVKSPFFDLSYSPIVQSGGEYDLRPTAVSTKKNLTHDCIIASIGGKYYEYNTNVVRTLFINATSEEETCYKVCYDAQEKLISMLRPGAVLMEIYTDIKNFIVNKYPNLAKNLPNNFGFGIGLEFRESTLLINSKNERRIKTNMVFNVIMSLKDLRTADGRPFAIKICDTILVTKDGPNNLTESIEKKYSDIGYQLDEPDEQEDIQRNQKKVDYLQQFEASGDGPLTRSKRRGKDKKAEEQYQIKIREHQADLLEEKCKELEEKVANGEIFQTKAAKNQVQLTKICSYRTKEALPKNIPKNSIYVDMPNDTVLLPVYGTLTAFHISTIKNVAKQNEKTIVSLRFNFNYPKISGNSNIVYPDPKKLEYHPIYIKELIFRSSRADHLTQVYKDVKELQKSYKQKEITDETGDDSGNLTETRGKKPVLKNLRVRPALKGRKTIGLLECHENGFKFVSKKGETLVVLFKNIKHAFYQPCDGEIIILVHFHLKTPMVVGKKKVWDVQFYTESGTVSEDLTDARRKFNEFNEEEQEMMEREQRKKLNHEFENYIKAVETFSNRKVTFDIPYRNLGFTGSYSNNHVLIVPTVRCLVHLTHSPFLVVPLEDVEVAFFERIAPTIKNFDLVLIMNDYHKTYLINAIPNHFKDHIRQWLDSCNILFFESTMNMKWDNMLKRISSDFHSFIQSDGGWRAFADDVSEDEDDPDNPERRADSDFDSKDFDSQDLQSESDYSIDDEDEDVEEESSDDGDRPINKQHTTRHATQDKNKKTAKEWDEGSEEDDDDFVDEDEDSEEIERAKRKKVKK